MSTDNRRAVENADYVKPPPPCSVCGWPATSISAAGVRCDDHDPWLGYDDDDERHPPMPPTEPTPDPAEQPRPAKPTMDLLESPPRKRRRERR